MSSLRTVVFCSTADAGDANGIASFMNFFASNKHGLAQRGFDVRFAYSNRLTADVCTALTSSERPEPNRTSFRHLVLTHLKPRVLRSKHGAFAWVLAAFFGRATMACVRARAVPHGSAVFFYQDAFCALVGLLLHPRNSARVLIHHAGSDPLKTLLGLIPALSDTVYERVLRRAFRYAESRMGAIATLGGDTAQQLARNHPHVTVKTIYSSTSLNCEGGRRRLPRPEEGPLRLIAVGSLQEHKGFDLLVDAVARLSEKRRSEVSVRVIGGGREFDALTRRAASAGVAGLVNFVGPSSEVANELQNADAFVLCSRNEGLPLALVEALAFRLPTIATKVGAIPELLGSTHPLLVDPSASALARAIELLLDCRSNIAFYESLSADIFENKLRPDACLDAYAALFSAESARASI